jgi:hypothetical protein
MGKFWQLFGYFSVRYRNNDSNNTVARDQQLKYGGISKLATHDHLARP